MKMGRILLALALVLPVAACEVGSKSGRGFRLPDGDVAAGKEVFVARGCLSCHAVAGLEDLREGVFTEMTVSLGGKTTRIATYGELVTSVINPSHRIAQAYRDEEVAEDGQSKMYNYNDVLTVSELIDLVAFLQDQYVLETYPMTEYPVYRYP